VRSHPPAPSSQARAQPLNHISTRRPLCRAELQAALVAASRNGEQRVNDASAGAIALQRAVEDALQQARARRQGRRRTACAQRHATKQAASRHAHTKQLEDVHAAHDAITAALRAEARRSATSRTRGSPTRRSAPTQSSRRRRRSSPRSSRSGRRRSRPCRRATTTTSRSVRGAGGPELCGAPTPPPTGRRAPRPPPRTRHAQGRRGPRGGRSCARSWPTTQTLTLEAGRLRKEHAEAMARTQAAADDAVRKLSARVAAAQAAGEEGRARASQPRCVCGDCGGGDALCAEPRGPLPACPRFSPHTHAPSLSLPAAPRRHADGQRTRRRGRAQRRRCRRRSSKLIADLRSEAQGRLAGPRPLTLQRRPCAARTEIACCAGRRQRTRSQPCGATRRSASRWPRTSTTATSTACARPPPTRRRRCAPMRREADAAATLELAKTQAADAAAAAAAAAHAAQMDQLRSVRRRTPKAAETRLAAR